MLPQKWIATLKLPPVPGIFPENRENPFRMHIGGHIFSETIIFAGELHIQAFAGPPFDREQDDQTGLMLWNMDNL